MEGERLQWPTESSRCKRKKREMCDVLELEKCPLPREVGPFFPLLTGGENIYKTNRAGVTSGPADGSTHLHVTAATHAELHSKTTFGCKNATARFPTR